MKRVLFLFLLIGMVVWFISRLEERETATVDPDGGGATRSAPEARHEGRHNDARARSRARRIVSEVQQALREARHDVREAIEEAREDVREALDMDIDEDEECESPEDEAPAAVTIASGPPAPAEPPKPSGSHALPPPPPQPPHAVVSASPGRKSKSKLKVEIKTNVKAEAEAEGLHTVVGLVSATEERAREEARKKLDEEVSAWLEPHGIPRSWNPPRGLVDEMIRETRIKPITKDYGTVYEAELSVDMSPRRRYRLSESYQHQLVNGRLVLFAGALAFVLACLAAVSGYIRADEATKGYYTNRLRVVAAAGVGAAGMAIYHLIA